MKKQTTKLSFSHLTIISKHHLSKSKFIRGLQCIKSLYILKINYELQDKISVEQQAIFDYCARIGILAQRLFTGDVDVNSSKHFQSVKLTAAHIKKTPIIYKAPFRYEGVLATVEFFLPTLQLSPKKGQ